MKPRRRKGPMTRYECHEARLAMALVRATEELPAAEYARLCRWLIDVCGAELGMIVSGEEDQPVTALLEPPDAQPR